MKQPMEANQETLDQFRSYLYLLARAHLGPRVQNKIDASDLVQQTLMDAHAKKSQFRGGTDDTCESFGQVSFPWDFRACGWCTGESALFTRWRRVLQLHD